MNRPENEPLDRHDPNDARFERLVDGELAPDEYRELVASLDDEPGGWRRCALSFLESQALAHELNGWMREATVVVNPVRTQDAVVSLASGPWGSFPRRWLHLATAASAAFVLAFGLSILVRGWWPASDVIVPPDAQMAGRQQEPVQATLSEMPVSSDAPPATPAVPRHVRLVVNSREIHLPVESMQPGAVSMFGQRRSMIPDDVERALERLGHQIQRRHHYIPLESLDGHDLVVPVEDVRIVPVSNRVFQ